MRISDWSSDVCSSDLLLLVARVVGELEQILGGDLRPQHLAPHLHIVTQFPVVESQTVVIIGLRRTAIGAIQLGAEQAVELRDGAFVKALFPHEDRKTKREKHRT